MTRLPPEFHVREFVRYFNEKNATELYELFSERAKLNHSIEELENALKFAEEFNITIVKWKIINNSKNDVVINKTITVPFVYKSYKTCEKIIIDGKLVNHTKIHFIGYIDR